MEMGGKFVKNLQSGPPTLWWQRVEHNMVRKQSLYLDRDDKRLGELSTDCNLILG